MRRCAASCCTPEAIATGTCGSTTDKCVPTPTQFVGDDGRCYERPGQACTPPLALYNGRCCNLREIQAGTCGDIPPPTLVGCTPPLLSHNGRCCNLREIQAGTCGGIPPPTQVGCSPPQFSHNGRCCNLREIQAGTCGGTPPPTLISDPCPGGAARVRGVCPGGPGGGACGANQFRGDDGKCQNKPKDTSGKCGSNQFRGDDGTCQNKPKTEKKKQPSCEGGRISNGRCVMPQQKKQQTKQQPKLNRQPVTGAKPKITAPPARTFNPPIQRGRGR